MHEAKKAIAAPIDKAEATSASNSGGQDGNEIKTGFKSIGKT
jgi:hypothetical protein